MRYRRLGGGYRKEDVEFALAELRLTLRQLDTDLESLRRRAGDLEEELRAARTELEGYRAKDAELSQTMASALHRVNEIEESAHQRARAIVAAAEDAAQHSRSEASRRIEETSGQFNEIIRLKENLVAAMRRVVGEFEQALSRVEHGESLFGRPPPAAPPPAAYAAPPAAAPPPPPPPPPPVGIDVGQPPLTPEQPAHYAPPPEPVAQEEPLFETQVELDAGPFPDFASLSMFERSLARLPRVDDVYVRRLADDRAVIELTLSEPTHLLATMREALPYDVQVQSASRSKLVINVLAHSTAAR
jgi:hypothetical protein